jgi:IMP dehydrogenase
MERAIKSIRDKCGSEVHIMAGNVATLEGINALSDWGADSARCNIGGGSICSTRIQTGHGVPGFETILQCSKTERDIKIIADGGIRNSGDAVKALAAGADFIMVGSMLAGTTQTPGEIVYLGMPGQDTGYKTYRGMASKEAQIDWRGRTASVEGVSSMVPVKGDVMAVLEDLERGIRSGFSYTGARTLGELHAKAKFIRQTAAGQSESGTHIMGVANVKG